MRTKKGGAGSGAPRVLRLCTLRRTMNFSAILTNHRTTTMRRQRHHRHPPCPIEPQDSAWGTPIPPRRVP